MSEPPRPSIRDMLGRVHLRLILFAVMLAAASLTLSGALVIRSHAQRNLDLMASTVAYTVEPAVVFGDRPAILEGIASVAASSGVRLVEVRDAQGQVIAEWTNARRGLPAWMVDAGNRLLWRSPATTPVTRGAAVIGEVRVFGNAEGLLRFAIAGTIIALCTLGLTIIATRILARRLERDVIGPLEHVAKVAHAVRTERSFARRVPEAGIAEIDRFGQDFNALLAELQGWHATMTLENAALAEQVLCDPLTGLGNRAAFEVAVGEAVTRAVMESRSFAVLYCDVDRFKAINDDHGHHAGDCVLVAIAKRLRAALRHDDRAFRVGGDEFVVLLTAVEPGESIACIAARLQAAVVPPVALFGADAIAPAISIGWAVYPDDGLSPAELLHRADRAMYRDKRSRHPINNGDDPCDT